MIPQVDSALAALVRREVLDGAQVTVAFDPPTKEWAARRSGPTVDLFLYDIREDVRRRPAGNTPVLDEAGRVTARRQPPRVFRLSYLVTAWTQRPEDEHQLLAAVLACLLRHERLPGDLLPAVNGGPALPPVAVTVGLPPEEDRSFADVWSALGGELRPSLDVILSVPFEAGQPIPAGPPVREPLGVDMADTQGTLAERRGGLVRREPAAEQPGRGLPRARRRKAAG